MRDDQLLGRVQRLVTQIAGPVRPPVDADPDTPLGAEGFGLDSVDLLESIVACEAAFGVIFAGEADLTPEVLSSARRFAALIASKGGR